MSVLTRHRIYLACATILFANVLLADAPPSVSGSRMAYDATTSHLILYGGATGVDSGTQQSYSVTDTWEWLGDRWIRLYPNHNPGGRALFGMVRDSAHDVLVLFGGRSGLSALNDTWIWDGNDWSQLTTDHAPSPRVNMGMAYDTKRGRTVLFGGSFSPDQKTLDNYYDTWEFDGTDWHQTGTNGPTVLSPIVTYDEATDQMILVGIDSASSQATLMYTYNAGAGTWTQIKPANLPPCVYNGAMSYQSHDGKVVLFGGICSSSAAAGDTWEWDGTNWTSIPTLLTRTITAAMGYDELRHTSVMFGGVSSLITNNLTFVYANHGWASTGNSVSPEPRSLLVYAPNPADQTLTLFGGINELNSFIDMWTYHDKTWGKLTPDGGPGICATPNGAFDTDRNRLMLLCADSSLWEFDGTKWTQINEGKTLPPTRSFSRMVYDQSLKKLVLFGGYDANSVSYLDETWVWNGSSWTRQKNNPPPRRSLHSMWYDPALKKTVIFGGIGQNSKDGRIERFNDTWSFDGNGWTQITPSGSIPSQRYGAQAAVDPVHGNVVLFGGLQLVVDGAKQSQVFVDDTWLWDGTKWTQLQTAHTPPPRENGGLAFDPTTNEVVLYGGYAGRYFGDVWGFNGTDWTLRQELAPMPAQPPQRRRTGGGQ